MNLYAITFWAHSSNGIVVDTATFLVDADSDSHEQTAANEHALLCASSKFPAHDGYSNHFAIAKRIPLDNVANLARMAIKVIEATGLSWQVSA